MTRGHATRSLVAKRLPVVHQVFGPGTRWSQFLSLTRIRISNITARVALLGDVRCHADVFAWSRPLRRPQADMNVYPVTFLMVQAVEGSATLFFLIIATLYAGELVWRERDTQLRRDPRCAALCASRPTGSPNSPPWPSSNFFCSPWCSSAASSARLSRATTTTSCSNTSRSFTSSPSPDPHLRLAALFLQTILCNKFIAHGFVIGLFILNIVLFNFGWENTLYLFGNTPHYTYSDMNGYGHFVPALFWSIIYWLALPPCWACSRSSCALRGSDDSWAARLRLAASCPRTSFPLLSASCSSPSAADGGTTTTLTSSTNISTPKRAAISRPNMSVTSRSTRGIPQPKIIAVDANIDIFPEQRGFSGTGHFVLQNKTAVPISQITSFDQRAVGHQRRIRPALPQVSSSPRDLYTIYAFEQPLAARREAQS